MENVCHTLAGFAISRALPGKRTALATTALVVGANLPDVDLAWSSFRSALVYFHAHRGFTHSFAGFVVLSLGWWAALLTVARLFRGRDFADRTRAAPLLLAAALGVASHIAMDAANSYGVRPYLPWSGRWVYGDLWAVVDPWLWLLLGGAVYLSGAGGRRRSLLWLMGAATAAIVVLATPLVPVVNRAAWAAGLGIALAIGRFFGRHPGRRAPARAGLGLVAAYALLCGLSHHEARARVEAIAASHPGWRAESATALPRPADPFRWEGIIVSATELRYTTVGAWPALDPRPAAEIRVLPRGLALPSVVRLMETCAGAVIREFFRFPCADIEDEAGGRVVVVRDARYTRSGRGFAVFTAPLDANGGPVVDEDVCPETQSILPL